MPSHGTFQVKNLKERGKLRLNQVNEYCNGIHVVINTKWLWAISQCKLVNICFINNNASGNYTKSGFWNTFLPLERKCIEEKVIINVDEYVYNE